MTFRNKSFKQFLLLKVSYELNLTVELKVVKTGTSESAAIQTWIYTRTRTRKLARNAFVLKDFIRWTMDKDLYELNLAQLNKRS